MMLSMGWLHASVLRLICELSMRFGCGRCTVQVCMRVSCKPAVHEQLAMHVFHRSVFAWGMLLCRGQGSGVALDNLNKRLHRGGSHCVELQHLYMFMKDALACSLIHTVSEFTVGMGVACGGGIVLLCKTCTTGVTLGCPGRSWYVALELCCIVLQYCAAGWGLCHVMRCSVVQVAAAQLMAVLYDRWLDVDTSA